MWFSKAPLDRTFLTEISVSRFAYCCSRRKMTTRKNIYTACVLGNFSKYLGGWANTTVEIERGGSYRNLVFA